ncbi:MAG: HAMP domain-containing protein, partial [Acetobacteraceae bacterium]|nr:HAMP domain-containing protein [Acetobacteraceae bacterium]
MRLPGLWPRSLAARTAAVLLIGLALVQAAGLTIHAWDQMEAAELARTRNLSERVMALYRTVVMTTPEDRILVLQQLHHTPGFNAELSKTAPVTELAPAIVPIQRMIRLNLALVPLPPRFRPMAVELLGGPPWKRLVVGLQLPERDWLNITTTIPPLRPWYSPAFLIAFALMTLAAAVLTLWAVRRLTAPVGTLAAAAEALGRDVNAPPLPENGPAEVATAAAAFNTMAARIRRFVQDRTEMLTAIGHDLRTPITRLKLRAEFMEDEDQRRKMLNDLD